MLDTFDVMELANAGALVPELDELAAAAMLAALGDEGVTYAD